MTMKIYSLSILYTLMMPLLIFSSARIQAQVLGCTDPLANNYNPNAIQNDGSCLYASASVMATATIDLSSSLSESSGLSDWNDCLWTHNDNSDIKLYCLDTLNASIMGEYPLVGLSNIDWEELSQDVDYFYIGDFGNNQNGNRTDLKIHKISKASLISGTTEIETINFSYSNQVNFLPTGLNNTNFDCEAMIVSSDSIYLFTKQWLDNQTSVYVLPKEAGSYTARFRESANVGGLITGASYLEDKNLVVLCGYSSLLQPFVYLLYDFQGDQFFGGNKRKLGLNLPFRQVEGIAGQNGLKYYITNERFSQPPVMTIPQALHTLDLSAYLGYYLQHLNSGYPENEMPAPFTVYPNLTGDKVFIVCESRMIGKEYRLLSTSGKSLTRGKIRNEFTKLSLRSFPAGMYILTIYGSKMEFFKIIKV